MKTDLILALDKYKKTGVADRCAVRDAITELLLIAHERGYDWDALIEGAVDVATEELDLDD